LEANSILFAKKIVFQVEDLLHRALFVDFVFVVGPFDNDGVLQDFFFVLYLY
jgi:hypothetical protein